MQASEMRFFRNLKSEITSANVQKIKDVTMLDKHRNTAIRESLDIESLLLPIKRFQLRWFHHVSRMPYERLPKQTLYAEVSGKCQLEDREQDGLIISGILVGTVRYFIQAKCSLCWWIERCGGLIWSSCPRNPLGKTGKKEDEIKL